MWSEARGKLSLHRLFARANPPDMLSRALSWRSPRLRFGYFPPPGKYLTSSRLVVRFKERFITTMNWRD